MPSGDFTAHCRSQMELLAAPPLASGDAPAGHVSLCAGRELNPGYELGKLMSYH
jgi:hypothetical protein